MESKEDAAVERQKLVPDDTENEQDDEALPVAPTVAAAVMAAAAAAHSQKTTAGNSSSHTPISPVPSSKVFSSGETSRTQDSSNGSLAGRGLGVAAVAPNANVPHSHNHSGTRLVYVNERTGSGRSSHHQALHHADSSSGKLSADGHKARKPARDDSTDVDEATVEVHSPIDVAPTPLQPTIVVDLHQTRPERRTPTTHPLAADAVVVDDSDAEADDGIVGSGCGESSAKRRPINESPQQQSTKASASATTANGPSFDQRQLKHHSFVSEVPDVRHMEQALLGLLEDFHMGKLKAFGYGCTMEQMTDIREQQERLARLHFELGSDPDVSGSVNGGLNAQENMSQLVAKLEKLSVSIERLHSSNTG